MSDYEYESYEDDYSDPSPNPQSAEQDLVGEYFPSSNGSGNYTDDTYLLDDDDDLGEYDEEPVYQPQPVTPSLVQEGFDIASRAAFMERMGENAAPLALLGQSARDWDAHMAARAQELEERELQEGYEVAAGIIDQERRNGGLHATSGDEITEVAEQVFQAAIAQGYEDGPELADASIRAACELLRNQEISRAALLKA